MKDVRYTKQLLNSRPFGRRRRRRRAGCQLNRLTDGYNNLLA